MRMRGNLLNGIPTRERRVTNDDAANPRTTLTRGLQSTSAGSVSVPGDRDHTGDDLPRSFSRDESRWHRVSR